MEAVALRLHQAQAARLALPPGEAVAGCAGRGYGVRRRGIARPEQSWPSRQRVKKRPEPSDASGPCGLVRALRVKIPADRHDASDRVEPWKRTQDKIREAILTRGWSDRASAFTQSFGSDDLDASRLMLALVGFLPAEDPRVLATINATEERLTNDRGLVYRYRSRDSLEGEEGMLLLCTFWLRPGPGPGRAAGSGAHRVRTSRHFRQRRRPARCGGRSRHRRASGQLSASLQPHRARQRSLGHF